MYKLIEIITLFYFAKCNRWLILHWNSFNHEESITSMKSGTSLFLKSSIGSKREKRKRDNIMLCSLMGVIFHKWIILYCYSCTLSVVMIWMWSRLFIDASLLYGFVCVVLCVVSFLVSVFCRDGFRSQKTCLWGVIFDNNYGTTKLSWIMWIFYLPIGRFQLNLVK